MAAHPSGKAATTAPQLPAAAEVAAILQVSPKTVSRSAEEIRQLAHELQVQPTA